MLMNKEETIMTDENKNANAENNREMSEPELSEVTGGAGTGIVTLPRTGESKGLCEKCVHVCSCSKWDKEEAKETLKCDRYEGAIEYAIAQYVQNFK